MYSQINIMRILKQLSTQKIRKKQLLYMLIGFSISKIQSIGQKYIHNFESIYKSNLQPLTTYLNILVQEIQIYFDNFKIKSNYFVDLFNASIVLVQSYSSEVYQLILRQSSKVQIQYFMEKLLQKFKQLVIYGSKFIKQQLFIQTNIFRQIHDYLSQRLNNILNEQRQQQKKLTSQQQTSLKNKQCIKKQCQICYCQSMQIQSQQISKPSNFYSFIQCNHSYHYACIHQYFKEIILNSSSYQELTSIKCPNVGCQSKVHVREIHNILYSHQKAKPLLQMYYDKLFQTYVVGMGIRGFGQLKNIQPKHNLNQIKNHLTQFNSAQVNSISLNRQNLQQDGIYFYCLTKGCNSIYQLDKICWNNYLMNHQVNVSNLVNAQNNRVNAQNSLINNIKKPDFICISCSTPYCLSCFNIFHAKMSCSQNKINNTFLKQDYQFQLYLKDKGKKYKKCPRCKFWVDNWRGCSTIKCRCGIQFCYKCGLTGCPHGKCNNIPDKTLQTINKS